MLNNITALIIAEGACQSADCLKAVGIKELVNPLTNRQTTALMLTFNFVRTTQVLGQGITLYQLVFFFLPVHDNSQSLPGPIIDGFFPMI